MEITVRFLKISAPKLSDLINLVDLAVVWRRGSQENETKGYVMNYIDFDQKMEDVFFRISGFYIKNQQFQDKFFTIMLKEYTLDDNGNRMLKHARILCKKEFNMKPHLDIRRIQKRNGCLELQRSYTIDPIEVCFQKIMKTGPVTVQFQLTIEQTDNIQRKSQFNSHASAMRQSVAFLEEYSCLTNQAAPFTSHKDEKNITKFLHERIAFQQNLKEVDRYLTQVHEEKREVELKIKSQKRENQKI